MDKKFNRNKNFNKLSNEEEFELMSFQFVARVLQSDVMGKGFRNMALKTQRAKDG